MTGKGAKARRGSRGATMIEYVVIAGIMLALVSVTALVLYAYKEYGVRVLNLVASEYP
jgi:Flp pilus assembly pilin Flp